MALKQPESAEECLYFTNRTMDDGRAMAWVYKKPCQKCKTERMGKPLKKGGKIDKKADHYVCYKCGYQEEAKELEEGLQIEIIYKCPFCLNSGETTTQYKRKNWQGIPSYVFECQFCKKAVGLTKKMKSKKGPKKEEDE